MFQVVSCIKRVLPTDSEPIWLIIQKLLYQFNTKSNKKFSYIATSIKSLKSKLILMDEAVESIDITQNDTDKDENN